MQSFKSYLLEQSSYKPLKITKLDIGGKSDLSQLKDKISDSLWMIEDNKPLYRAHDTLMVSSLIDTTDSQRISRNTTNYYTAILDNHPQRSDFPKRGKSLICTTDLDYAEQFTDDGKIWRAIPLNGAKIGVVGRNDIWSTVIQFLGIKLKIHTMNRFFEELRIRDGDAQQIWADIQRFAGSLKSGDLVAVKLLDFAIGALQKYAKMWGENAAQPSEDDMKRLRTDFMGEILKAYSAESTGHSFCTTKTFKGKHPGASEVWIEGQVLMLSADDFDSLRSQVNTISTK